MYPGLPRSKRKTNKQKKRQEVSISNHKTDIFSSEKETEGMKRIVFWFYEEKLLQYHIKQIFLGISGKVLQYY